MFEARFESSRAGGLDDDYPPDIDVDLLLATDPVARAYAEDCGAELSDAAEMARLEASWADWARQNLDRPERVFTEQDRPLCDRDPDTLTDGEALRRLVEVEASMAHAQALRARLIELIAAQRPACDDRPPFRAGSASVEADPNPVPEVLEVSEWLSHELQMAHPYSRGAALDLVDTSLILRGRLRSTWELLAGGRIDYPRARVLADLLGSASEAVAHTVEGMVLPKAPALTPAGLATAIRRALVKVDARAVRRRQAGARRNAGVQFWPTADGMARLVADLPLPVAAACVDAIGSYAQIQQRDGDTRPIGQIRTEVLTDLILRPWDTTRPAVTGDLTVHITLPATSDVGARSGTSEIVDADVDGYSISAAQCRELVNQLDRSRVFLALHDSMGGLQAVINPADLRRAARTSRRAARRTRVRGTDEHVTDSLDGEGLGLRRPAPSGRYTPTRAQDRYVRTRDRTCRHFGCARKAVHCDLDHHIPWPHGSTAVCNLCCYCRTHHRLKHQAPGWTREFQPDGTLTIHTPTGITRTTRPPGGEQAWAPSVGTLPKPATDAASQILDPPPF